MRMYVKVMAAVIACILLSGEALSAFATTPANRKSEIGLKRKKRNQKRKRRKKRRVKATTRN